MKKSPRKSQPQTPTYEVYTEFVVRHPMTLTVRATSAEEAERIATEALYDSEGHVYDIPRGGPIEGVDIIDVDMEVNDVSVKEETPGA